MRVDTAEKSAESTASDEHGEPGSLRHRNPNRQMAHPLRRVPVRARDSHDSEGSGNGQYAGLDRKLKRFSSKAWRIKSIKPTPARVGIGQMQRQGPQIAGGGDKFGVTEYVLRRNRFARNTGVARQQRRYLVLALLRLQ